MSGLSARQLLQVLVNQKDYVPEALDAMRQELEAAEAEGKRLSEVAAERADLPLEKGWEYAYFFGAILVCTPFIAFLYRYHGEKGYHRRAQESLRMTFLGILFYIALLSTLHRLLA